jgi:hypothetical protein
MTQARIHGLLLFLAGSALLVWVGTSWERSSHVSMIDFRAVYCGARSLIEHRDPYSPDELGPIYVAEAGGYSSGPLAKIHLVVTRYIYLPTAFVLTVPFALLPWGAAHVAWMISTGAYFILAAFLMWGLASTRAPVISGWLICLFLLTSELLIEVGNAAGIAVSLCVIAVWCFLQERFVPVGILCLAISLLVKPHDAGLVWLYFLLASGVPRKRALQTLLVVAVLALPTIFWVSSVSPNWVQEMHSNLSAHSTPGDDSDPGPRGIAPVAHGAQLISLQTVFSTFRDDSKFYNPASYLLSGALLAVWSVAVIRSRFTPANAWLALASVAALTMLPTYHRQQDTRLLLLMFPAFSLLWSERGPIRWLALAVSTVGVVFTGDIPLQLLGILTYRLGVSVTSLSGQLLTLFLARPAPLALLAVGTFYLWAYVRRNECGLTGP